MTNRHRAARERVLRSAALGVLGIALVSCGAKDRPTPTEDDFREALRVSLTRADGNVEAAVETPDVGAAALSVEIELLIEGAAAAMPVRTTRLTGTGKRRIVLSADAAEVLGSRTQAEVRVRCRYAVKSPAGAELYAGDMISEGLEVKAADELSPREKKFQAMLSGAKLTGNFTIVGQEAGGLSQDTYEILKIEKVYRDNWNFSVRMRYGGNDQTFSYAFPISWAGETPMIEMTKMSIPGIGTFSTRVLFFGDRYAGTWTHGDVKGHLFGRIVR
jgi:hypothetical protein